MTPTEALAVMTEEFTAEWYDDEGNQDAFNRARSVVAAALEARFPVQLVAAPEDRHAGK